MLNEFYKNSFFPNKIDINFKRISESKFDTINILRLKSDFQKLYIDSNPPILVSKDCSVLIIKSMNDRILSHSSSFGFIDLMNKTQIKKPRIIEIEDQGHIINNHKIFKLIDNWIQQ